MIATPPPACRRRWLFSALALTIAAGLASRWRPLPGLFAEYLGDALYATAALWGCALVAPRARPARLAAVAFALAALVELSQCLRYGWLTELRATRLGRLVLGQGFQWQDLVAYAAGALLGGCVLAIGRRRAPPSSAPPPPRA